MQNLMQIRCSIHLVILIATTIQYTCSLNSIYHPHWPVQRNCHCSHMRIPVHFPWLPGNTDVAQTIFVILMAGLFTYRPRIYKPRNGKDCLQLSTRKKQGEHPRRLQENKPYQHLEFGLIELTELWKNNFLLFEST